MSGGCLVRFLVARRFLFLPPTKASYNVHRILKFVYFAWRCCERVRVHCNAHTIWHLVPLDACEFVCFVVVGKCISGAHFPKCFLQFFLIEQLPLDFDVVPKIWPVSSFNPPVRISHACIINRLGTAMQHFHRLMFFCLLLLNIDSRFATHSFKSRQCARYHRNCLVNELVEMRMANLSGN